MGCAHSFLVLVPAALNTKQLYTHTWYTRPRPARQHLSPIAELTISLCSYRRHVGRGGLAHEGESRSLSRAHVSCSSWCLLLWMPANLHFGSVYT